MQADRPDEGQESCRDSIDPFQGDQKSGPPRIPFLPFIIADMALLVTALAIFSVGSRPLGPWEIGAVVSCVALGGWIVVYPFRKVIDMEMQKASAHRLNQSVARIQNLESIATRIETASANWMEIEKKTDASLNKAEDISREMIEEADSFREFLANASNEETQHLRLMVDKLKKTEKDWIQIIMAMMDHVIALRWAAQKSGNQNLAGQISNFHNQLVEITRQVGLLPFEPAAGEDYDPDLHQPYETELTVAAGTPIEAVKTAGFRFRGVVIRKALVYPKVSGDSPSKKQKAETSSAPAGRAPRKAVSDSEPPEEGSSEDQQTFL